MKDFRFKLCLMLLGVSLLALIFGLIGSRPELLESLLDFIERKIVVRW